MCRSFQGSVVFIVMKHLAVVIILGAASVVAGQDLVDQVFGEALLKSLSPSLREKLEEIHNTEVLKKLSESQMARVVKTQLTTEEVKELETAYKKLILPMLQNTLEERMGRKYENLDDIPVEFEDDEETEGEVDDFKTESEELVERKAREKKSKEKEGDTPRTVKNSVENSDKWPGDTESVKSRKREDDENSDTEKDKTEKRKNKTDQVRAKEEL